MKITQIDSHKVIVPMKPGTVNSPQWGEAGFDEIPKFVIKVHTDEGIHGIGETYRGITQGDVDAGVSDLIGTDAIAMNLSDLPIPRNSA